MMKKVIMIMTLFTSVQVYSQTQSDSANFDFEVFKRFVDVACQHPVIVISQAGLETGWFTSQVFREYHNCFGMKHNKRGWSIGAGRNGYAIYRSWWDSVMDYSQWQQSHYNGGDYLHFLASVGYAEDPKYIIKLKLVLKTWE